MGSAQCLSKRPNGLKLVALVGELARLGPDLLRAVGGEDSTSSALSGFLGSGRGDLLRRA